MNLSPTVGKFVQLTAVQTSLGQWTKINCPQSNGFQCKLLRKDERLFLCWYYYQEVWEFFFKKKGANEKIKNDTTFIKFEMKKLDQYCLTTFSPGTCSYLNSFPTTLCKFYLEKGVQTLKTKYKRNSQRSAIIWVLENDDESQELISQRWDCWDIPIPLKLRKRRQQELRDRDNNNHSNPLSGLGKLYLKPPHQSTEWVGQAVPQTSTSRNIPPLHVWSLNVKIYFILWIYKESNVFPLTNFPCLLSSYIIVH